MPDHTDMQCPDGTHKPDDLLVSRDFSENRVFLFLLSTSRVLLLFFLMALLDAFAWHWINMAISVGIGLIGVLLRIFLGLLNHETPNQWLAEPPILILRLILCFLYESDSCVAFKQSLSQEPEQTRHRLPKRPRPRLAGYRLHRRLEDLDDFEEF